MELNLTRLTIFEFNETKTKIELTINDYIGPHYVTENVDFIHSKKKS